MDVEGSSLPITYRPIVLFTIGVLGWGLNLSILSHVGIDPVSLLQLHQADKHTPLYKAVFFLAGIMAGLVLVNLWTYWYIFTLPAVAALPYVSALVLLFWPGNVMYRKERVRFIKMLKRVLSFNVFAPVFFSDIILADMLTSFSNVFGDFFLATCVIVAGHNSEYFMDNNKNFYYQDIMVPLLISLPYLIRLKQCISEYIESKEKRHLFNATKYASSIPVVIFSAIHRKANMYISENGSIPAYWYLTEDAIFKFWISFVFLNSMYSFWWDISMDWNLISISFDTAVSHHSVVIEDNNNVQKQTTTPTLHFRRQLYFSQRSWYMMAIFFDFLLRITWSLKLSSHIYIRQLEGSIFIIELLEVIRRWVWVIFRLESEWVKKVYNSLPLDIRLNLLDRKTSSGILSPIIEESDP